MKIFLLATLVALAIARPEPDIGLELKKTYGTPVSSVGSLSAHEQVKSDVVVTPTPPPSSFEVPIFGNAQFQSGAALNGVGNAQFQSSAFNGGGIGDQLVSFDGPNIFAQQGGFAQQGDFAQQAGFGVQPNIAFGAIHPEISLHSGASLDSVGISNHQTEVQKHVYFYTAPEDIEVPRQRVLLPQAPSQKHYKIIFIKAPTFNLPPSIEIPAPVQNEEKTLVYVLVKKPDEAGEIRVATPPPTPPSKPEVYFIKYKTQKEAEEAVSSVHSGNINPASLGGNSVEGEHAFVSSIAQDSSRSGISNEGGIISTTISPIGTTFGTTIAPFNIQSSTINPFINERFGGIQSSTIGPLDLPNINFNSAIGGGNFGDFGLQSSTISPLSGYSGLIGGDFGVQSSTVSPLGGFSGLAFNGGGFGSSTISPLGASGLQNVGVVSSTTPTPVGVGSAGTIGGSISGEHLSNAGVSDGLSGTINEVHDDKFASGISYSGSSTKNLVVPHKAYGVPNKK